MSTVAVLSPPVNVLENVHCVGAAGVHTPRHPCPGDESDSPPPKKLKRARSRRKKRKNKKSYLRNKPVAPFNTTQFLMADHDQLRDSDFHVVVARPPRHRDSSMSMDSDVDDGDYYYSPEDEEEFLTKEFWAAYEDVHAERLDTMTKAQLVQEYLTLEERVDILERQLKVVRAHQRRQRQNERNDDDEVGPGEVKVDEETAEKIDIFRKEIKNLEMENEKLRQENQLLRESSQSSSSSSSGSSSDSDSSTDSDSEEVSPRERKYEVSVTVEGAEGVDSSGAPPSLMAKTIKSLSVHPDSGVSCGCGSSSSSSEDIRLDELDPPSGEKQTGSVTPVATTPLHSQDNDTEGLKEEESKTVKQSIPEGGGATVSSTST